MHPSLAFSLFLLGAFQLSDALDYRNPTPPMGWNSYNYYNCKPNEDIIKSNAKGLVDLGFADLGYTRVTPDCGWPAANRTASGELTWNTALFPSGFLELGSYLHGLGLKFGVYSGGGVYQCGSGPGSGAPALPASLGHEATDAETFASWGADYLKYDNCWTNSTLYVSYDPNLEADPSARFRTMANALNQVNRSIEYEICQWGTGYDIEYWAPPLAETWRVSNDIATKAAGGSNFWESIWRIANEVVPYAKHTGHGKYPDMDMLIVGLGLLSYEEERFHFGLWAINKSPLVIGAPMNASITTNESLAILSNKEIIAIDQDPLNEQAQLIRRYTEEQYDIWAGNQSSNKFVVAVTNWANTSTTVNLNLLDTVGVVSASAVRDVWNAKDFGSVDGSKGMQLQLAGHEAKILVLSDVQLTTPASKSLGSTYYPASSATLSGNATVVDCSNISHYCLPTKSKVTIYPGASALFASVNIPASGSNSTTKVVGVDFINYDIAFWTGDNTRNFTVAVNGGTPKRWAFPISGGNWYETGRLDIEVTGFVEGANNTIMLAADASSSTPAPDIVGLEVYF